MTILAPSDEGLVRGLGDFARHFLGDVTIVRGYVNRVSRPKSRDYVLITLMTQTPTGRNRHAYDAEAERITVSRPTQRRTQIDCYGQYSEAWAKTLATLLHDEIGCDFLRPYGFAPLYVDDAQDLTQADGTEQYAKRWMLGVMTEGPESVTTAQQFFNNVAVSLLLANPAGTPAKEAK